MNEIKRIILFVLGTLFLILGFFGVFVPVLPTTPFILLAAACYARASERAHAWLLRSRMFGPMISRWQKSRTISMRTKCTAISLLVLTIGSSMVFFVRPLGLRIMLAVIMVGVSVFILRIPTREPQLAPDSEDESGGRGGGAVDPDLVEPRSGAG